MRILLGEVNRQLGQQVEQRLLMQFSLDSAKSVPLLNSLMLSRSYGLIILAMDVPGEDRAKLIAQCRRVSQKSAIIVVTDPIPVQERVQALEAGADDILMRPVHPDEFIARARALMRRMDPSTMASQKIGNLELSDDGELYLNGKRTELQQAEHKVLSILVRRSGRIVTKDMIDRAVAGAATEELSPNAIEQRLSRLRKILENSNARVQITTIRGSGYILELKQHVPAPAARMESHGTETLQEA